ncbi:hypothetical protein CAPTEDRAFT_221269 [Capitella teleta]|uniref:BHLH domain-containing protein n=1 Tax=Capitella teleta TaxID=283909 RepID=R7V815_CAPTE|nr:hypothetical protein CAPTEDRAFT_221269 [Capitella teleta]|eukprot:ELU11900.1 hypothetical protein CAPTEDRAFT_221269 [Capitella teleta]
MADANCMEYYAATPEERMYSPYSADTHYDCDYQRTLDYSAAAASSCVYEGGFRYEDYSYNPSDAYYGLACWWSRIADQSQDVAPSVATKTALSTSVPGYRFNLRQQLQREQVMSEQQKQPPSQLCFTTLNAPKAGNAAAVAIKVPAGSVNKTPTVRVLKVIGERGVHVENMNVLSRLPFCMKLETFRFCSLDMIGVESNPVAGCQVQTRLQNPTKYHVQQMQHYLPSSSSEGNIAAATVQSLPSERRTSSSHRPSTSQQLAGSAPLNADPDSPLSMGMSSAATSVSEMDDILGDIMSLESVDPSLDPDLSLVDPSVPTISQTLPQSTTYFENVYDGSYDQSGGGLSDDQSSSSCPADPTQTPGRPYKGGRRREEEPPGFLSEEQVHQWAKERQKKDNHNQIERRRRFNINDRIKELGTMLPKNVDPDMRHNKGTILKASCDYIRRLRKHQERLQSVEDEKRRMESNNRKMILRIQELEMLLRSHGISHPAIDNSHASSSELLTNAMIQGHPEVKPEVKQEGLNEVFLNSGQQAGGSLAEELLDDGPAVTGMDHMLSDFIMDGSTVSMDDVMQ